MESDGKRITIIIMTIVVIMRANNDDVGDGYEDEEGSIMRKMMAVIFNCDGDRGVY